MNTLSSAVPEQLADSQFLADVLNPSRENIIGNAVYRQFAAKSVLVEGGADATHLFILCSGGAKYYRTTKQGEELLLRWLVPGDVFGLATLLRQPPPYMGNVQATKSGTLYMWTHAKIRELSGTYPKLAENALRITLSYLSAYAERHAGLRTKTAEERLAHALVHLGHRAGRVQPTGVEVDITNEQLGGLADVGLFTASRVLSKWERKGAVIKRRGGVFIQSPERLLSD